MNNNIRDLEIKVAQAATLPAKIGLQNDLAWALRDSDYQRALSLSEEVQQLNPLPPPAELAHSLTVSGFVHMRQGRFEQAMTDAFTARDILEDHEKFAWLPRTYNLIAILYKELGNPVEAMTYLYEQLHLSQSLDDKDQEATAYHDLGLQYLGRGQYENGIVYLNKARLLFQEMGDIWGQILAFYNLGDHYLEQGDIQNAADCCYQAIQISEYFEHENGRGLILLNFGAVLAAQGKYEEAVEQYQRALDIGVTLANEYLVNNANLQLGTLSIQQNQMETAKGYLQTLWQRCQKSQNKDMLYRACQALSRMYKQVGNYEQALLYHEQFYAVKEDIFNHENTQKLHYLEVLNRTEAARHQADLLQEKNRQLEQEITERKQIETMLRQAKESAEVANQAKNNFLSNMSHELRTPLNGILGYTQLLKQDDNLTIKQQRGLKVIEQSGRHLLTLISDILDIAKIEIHKLKLYPSEVELPNLLHEVADIVRPDARHKAIDFVYKTDNIPSKVVVDEKRLRQILLNLLSNAIKFTDVGSVTFTVTNLDNDVANHTVLLRFEVSDTGMGIASEDQDRIFQPFEQATRLNRAGEGTGLGLAVSSQLISAMGSYIHLSSHPNQGSRFWFDLSLPIAQATSAKLTVTHKTVEEVVSTAVSPLPLPKLPPMSQLETLYKLALMGDMPNLRQQTHRLVEQDLALHPFAHQIVQLADEFEDEQILALLEKYIAAS